ncbi:ATP-binding protein [Roseiconus lacunae]|uniref:histidine kinase n=1 Tax=Roseiconus lacunae TaxID=2605694 RepID=A0ABT7PFZ2_9BACT|nr:ATP-binding protein [Roseiconus lacunae]MCD0460544.1 response regulator [Roseiconus lacunae]MDM4015408.1 ATP-binding protein [Roseiconus lacunae]WRQ52914.1 ATP-binding protein [Stieleria sp. HD01]
MSEFFQKLLNTDDFPARWYCGNWSDFLGWLHIVSDAATFGAYFAIPIALIIFARKRRDFPYPKLFWLFASFILACGTVHAIEAIIFWHPIYRVSGLVKVIMAVVSWVTVIVLIRHMPQLMSLPSISTTVEQLKEEIVHREETERRLREAKDRHDAILRSTRSIVWTTNSEGQFLIPQISWERYTGQTWAEHQGMGWSEAIHEDDRAELIRGWKEAVIEGKLYQTTGRIWHRESQSFRRFVVEAVPVKNADGSTREWVGTISDVEDQYRAETNLGIIRSELERQKRELELIYQAAPVGMSLVDSDLRFKRVNESLAEIHGLPIEDHIGRSIHEVIPTLTKQLTPIYEQVFQSGQETVGIEVVGTTSAGPQRHTWLASFYPLWLTPESEQDISEGSVSAVSAIIQDITERKAQERRLKKSEKAAQAASRSKSEFLANMSHEIRTPMSAILGYADVLLGHLHDPDNRNCVLIMKRNGEYLLELINDILDLSRIEAGKLDIDPEDCALPELVADIQSLMQVRAEEKGVDFDIHFDGMIPKCINADPKRLRQVLINLIGNAIKFTEEGRVILKVKFVKDETPQLEFAVEDTGIGMTDEQIERLFKPFSQGDTSVRRKFGGSGLGLAISHRLVDMMQGELDLESEIGAGSTFYVRLPLEAEDELELIRPSLIVRTEPEVIAPKKLPPLSAKILVVDDRRDIRHISQHFLEKAGADVTTAEDGGEAIRIVGDAVGRGEAFDLIVMDMQMPNVDGLEATAQLRSMGVEWPIIALTADAMKGDRQRCLNGGCDDYLSKPIDHAKLVAMAVRYTQEITPHDLRTRRLERADQLRDELEDQT